MISEMEAPAPPAAAKPSPDRPRFRLAKDGKEIMVGREYECWRWLHAKHPNQSVAYATARMGYTLEPVNEQT